MPHPVLFRRLPVPSRGLPFADFPQDDFSDYAVGQESRGQGLGRGKNGSTTFTILWTTNWLIEFNYLGAQAGDDLETYTDGASLNGLNGDTGWAIAYVDRDTYTGMKAQDDMESYSTSAALDGLNGGTGWAAAYVDR